MEFDLFFIVDYLGIKMNNVEVIKVGSPVIIGVKIDAVVTEILIGDKDNITYKCSWWNGFQHYAEWFEEFEVKKKEEADIVRIKFQKTVGFIST